MKQTGSTSEAIISDVLGRAPDAQIGSVKDGFVLSRWRQFVGAYNLPALPEPLFVVHLAGKPSVRHWDRDMWSEAWSVPGCATIVPAGLPTGWLVDGELDVVTLSVSPGGLDAAPPLDQVTRMKFAFSDPLGVALTKQVLAEIYAPVSAQRDAYVGALVSALKAHVLRAGETANSTDIPVSAFSSYRIHKILNAILSHPEEDHSLEKLAAVAGVTAPHFCRVFKSATGQSPHQYVMMARLNKAQQMLEQSQLSIGLVAEQLGFTSQSHFCRAFHKFTGTTPSEYRVRTLQTVL
ncbi:AraC family transcriptional regulator [Oleomonas cavernae]|uniref:AraC family transcriptional regulator n=1 Tax=Oleomonas cavernae TaxID=2320859 RepID=A0A418WFM1_9PROT|nr:AraC family transcriptional regulator [Oleomonas cavernae]RJF88817.1 AraC family transcriptional regulator [Oleomonas cavernae]